MSAEQDRFQTRAVHAGLDPDPTYGSVIPPIHQTSTFAQKGVGEFVEDFDYARSANPTRAALERALGELEGGLGTSFSSGMAATHGAAHRRLLGGRPHRDPVATSTAAPTASSTRSSRAGACATRWSTRPTSTPSRRP